MGKFLNLLKSMSPSSGRKIRENGTMFNTADLAERVNQGMTTYNELISVTPRTKINLNSTHPLSKLKDIVTGVAGGDVVQENGYFNVSVPADGTAEVLFRSLDRGRYVPGLDALAGMGIRIPTRPTGNQVIEWGFCDFVNGYVTGEDASGLYTAVYRDGVQMSVHRREDWDNPLPGELNPANLTIYRQGLRYYGSGPFKLSLATEFEGDGRVTRADGTSLADSGPIVTVPDQPLSVRIRNNGTVAPMEVHTFSRQFSVMGDTDNRPRMTSGYRLEQTVGNTFVPGISFRQKGGIYESISTALQAVNLITASADIIWQVRVFPTLTGATFTAPPDSENGTETALESDTAATAMSGGITLYEGLLAGDKGNSGESAAANLPQLELPAMGNVISLCFRAVSGTATVTSVFIISERW